MRLNRKRLRDALANVGVALMIAGLAALVFETQKTGPALVSVVMGVAAVILASVEEG